MSQDTHSESTRSSWAELRINGVVIPADKVPTLYGGQDNKVQVKDTSGEVSQVRVGLVQSDVVIVAKPDFLENVSAVGGFFTWFFSVEDNQSGTAKVVFFSPENDEVLEVTCNIEPGISFGFIYLTDNLMPVPPEVVNFPINTYFLPGVLLTSKGVPVEGVTVNFTVPEHESSQGVTGPAGKTHSEPVQYRSIGPRTLRASAALSTGNVSVELLLNIKAP